MSSLQANLVINTETVKENKSRVCNLQLLNCFSGIK